MTLGEGDLFADRFRVLKRVEDGGTACVFRAFDGHANAQVALKTFKDGPDSAITGEIWHREAQALQKLSHACIVKLIDFGRCVKTGIRYIATEWIDGRTLHECLVQAGPINWVTFKNQFGDRLLDALCHVYENNVSHRDLSPKNVLIGNDGSLKLIDFGIAKLSSAGIGQTLAYWKTPPYCPPEEDTGRFTLTRDPYSFAAIVVRAVSGKDIQNHDELYDVFEQLELEVNLRAGLEKALSREPRDRYENVVAFRDSLQSNHSSDEKDRFPAIPIRFVPNAIRLQDQDQESDVLVDVEQQILGELNDAVAVQLPPVDETPSKTRILFETASHRLIVDLAGPNQDHLVIIGVSPKRFSLDGLYRRESWLPSISFHQRLPKSQTEKNEVRAVLERFYRRAEQELTREDAQTAIRGDEFLEQWSRVLDAMREMERARIPPLKYRYLNVSGRRLYVELENPADAEEGQIRSISKAKGGRWVFKGEIEYVAGAQCCLYSRQPFFSVEDIPASGDLEHDWTQARKALDRQAAALERFRGRDTPSEQLRKLLLLDHKGNPEQSFATVPHFADDSLNTEKKEVVSRFMASQDLLLVHGPPGTGKTKVIVEIIRQEIQRNASSKILLVSQTHVALDNALAGVVSGAPSIPAVRISSGGKEMSALVKRCSVEARGAQLQSQVLASSERFLRSESIAAKVDYDQLVIGVRASELLNVRRRQAQASLRCTELEIRLQELKAAEELKGKEGSTREYDETRAKQRALSDELDSESEELSLLSSQLKMSIQSLSQLGREAKDLAQLSDKELDEWCALLLEGPDKARLRRLVEIAEEWRLKFLKSDDFKAAIIAGSQIVAGTCVGFGREEAATATDYDLCIVDEASKATSTELLLPLSRCRRAVLVGDHCQLPPFVEYALTTNSLVQKYGFSPEILEAQLFESLQEKLAEGQRARLRLQYRMRGAIGRLVSECFYDRDLASGLTDDDDLPFGNLSLAGLKKRVIWYDTESNSVAARERLKEKSYVNPLEVNCIISLLKRLHLLLYKQSRSARAPSIGVISGYGEQVIALDREIRRHSELSNMAIECNSVHTFQGREVDICIYSAVRNNSEGNIGFLADWRHLNVALSRARWHLVIVGSLKFWSSGKSENPFSRVVEFVTHDDGCDVKEWADE